MKTTLTPLWLIRVTSRLMCIIMFCLWGFVILFHLHWFFPLESWPPAEIWFGRVLLIGLVASYPLFFWKPKLASKTMTACALIFFFFIAYSGGAVAYFALSTLPALLYLIEYQLRK